MRLLHYLTGLLVIGYLWTTASAGLSADSRSLPIQYTIHGLSKPLSTQASSYLKQLPTDLPLHKAQMRARATIQAFLEANGYFHSRVETTIHQTAKGHQLNYAIETGPQLNITGLSLQLVGPGETHDKLQHRLNELRLKQGEPMTTRNYLSIKETLYDGLIAEGYLQATWKTHTVAIDLERYTATITLVIDTGPLYTVGPIEYVGDPLNHAFLNRYLNFQEGSPYRVKDLLASQRLLQDSGYFQHALIDTNIIHHDSLALPVRITLSPTPRYCTLASFGFSTDRTARIKLAGFIRRLNQQGHQVEGTATLTQHRVDCFSQYTIPSQSSASQKHQLKLHGSSRYHALTDSETTYFNQYIMENPTATIHYLYTKCYPNWDVRTELCLHHERFTLPTHSQEQRYRGLIIGMVLNNNAQQWSFESTHHYQINGKTQLAIEPFSRLHALRMEGQAAYFSRLSKQMPLSYWILRGRTGSLLTPSLDTIPTSLRFEAGDDHYPRGHKHYLLGSHFLSGGIETRIHLSGLLYAGPFAELIYNAGPNKIVKGSTGIGLYLWYPKIGSIEISSVIRINPEANQGRYGLLAKISNH